MGSKEQSYKLLLFWGLLLWITTLLINSCNALPKPQSSFNDDDDDKYFANFAATKGAPLINPLSSEITLDVKSNFSLLCEANEPITWRSSAPIGSELENSSFPTLNSDRPYGNSLHLEKVTAEYVGFYYCIKESELIQDGDYDMMVENFKAAKIYVFVNDENTLLVPMSVPVISASQYDDVVIPCKPTMPDTVVELITVDQQ